jgi:hypothetical protein
VLHTPRTEVGTSPELDRITIHRGPLPLGVPQRVAGLLTGTL